MKSLLAPRGLRALGLCSVVALSFACTPTTPAVSPEGGTPAASASATASAAPSEGPDVYMPAGPFNEAALPKVETAPLAAGALKLPPVPAGVAAAPAMCTNALKVNATEVPACSDRATALAALDQALAKGPADPASADEAAVVARDAALAVLEGCAWLPSGLVRALRADLLPAACGDVMAEPILSAPPADLRADIHEALFGLALAARFARVSAAAPALAPPFTRDRVEKHIAGPVQKWMRDVATSVQELSGAASKLPFYGGAVAAVAAGTADLALVETVRGAPIPDELQKDEERRNIYYAALDEKLEPRKTRGRNAALAGLLRFAEVGSIDDRRVREARRLLSKLYGGRRIDALDRLIVPAAPAGAAGSMEARLADRLPSFYAGILLDAKLSGDAAVLPVLARRGLPLAHRAALREGTVSPEIAPIVARAYLDLGRTYFRASDFESAAKAMSLVPPASRTPELKLLAGLSMGLRGGPKDAVEMMVKSPLGMNALGQRAALDALALEKGPLSGAAAFDGAYVMEIAAPERADGLFFKSIAKRYEAAAEMLVDPAQKKEAEERAKAALAIAGEVK
ncbi:MAG: hypothetical protein R3B70_20390 [Polyangiaceae bacterium]